VSYVHYDQVRQFSGAKGPARLVFFVIASYMDDESKCWPSLATIARDAFMGRTQTVEAIGKLVESGEVRLLRSKGGRSESGSGCSNVYQLTGQWNVPEIRTVRKPEPIGIPNRSETRLPNVPEKPKERAGNPATIHQEPSVEPPIQTPCIPLAEEPHSKAAVPPLEETAHAASPVPSPAECLEAMKVEWRANGLHKTERSSQGWSGNKIEKQVAEVVKEAGGIQRLQIAIRAYAQKLKSSDGWQKGAQQFSTFFGPGKATWKEYVAEDDTSAALGTHEAHEQWCRWFYSMTQEQQEAYWESLPSANPMPEKSDKPRSVFPLVNKTAMNKTRERLGLPLRDYDSLEQAAQ